VGKEDGWEHTTHKAKVEYEYSVFGVSHSADRIAFGYSGSSFGWWVAEQHLEPYHPGAQVVVYYDPNNPAESVLEPGMSKAINSRFVVFIMFAAAFFTVFGFWLSEKLAQ
jgi:hypothetical protein